MNSSYAQDLIQHARLELGGASSSGAPRQADLRRAVSTAYYALFHAICAAAADRFIGKAASVQLRAVVLRSFSHREMVKVCQAIENGNPGSRYGRILPTPLPADLCRVASAFVQLQKARHAADYDPVSKHLKAEAQAHIDSAENALSLCAALSKEPAFEAFLLVMHNPTGLRA